MKISFICNQNQARSQIMSAVFAKLLQSCEFNSFGLIAREGTPLPMIIDSVFRDWGLEPEGRFARNMGIHSDEVLEMDITVAITSLIAEEVRAAGFRGLIVDLEEEAVNQGISVTDPQLMPRRQCAFELAKYVKVAISAFQRIGLIEKSPHIVAFMPDNEASISSAVAMAGEQAVLGSSVLLGDLVAPVGLSQSEATAPIRRFKVHESSPSIEVSASLDGSGIYLPKSSTMHPAKIYLGRPWFEFILKIKTESLIIVTPPQENLSGKLAESYLGALYASKIQAVRS